MVTEPVIPPGGGQALSVRGRDSPAGLWGWREGLLNERGKGCQTQLHRME